jgi:hypothetical protein
VFGLLGNIGGFSLNIDFLLGTLTSYPNEFDDILLKMIFFWVRGPAVGVIVNYDGLVMDEKLKV